MLLPDRASETGLGKPDFKMVETSDKDLPLLSVIIPVRNEAKYIGRTLRYLAEQDYPDGKLEILVVDGRSDDGTRAEVEKFSLDDNRVRLLDNPNRLSSSARNIGAREANGEIIVYIDGHVFIDNNLLLKNTAVLMMKDNIAVLSRPQFLETPENTPFQKGVAMARKSVFGHGLDSTIYLKEERFVDPTSSGASYKKEIFERVGYFDENFDAAEDLEFNYRVGQAGFESLSSPKLTVYYYPRSDLKGLYYQMKRYGAGRFRFFRKHKEVVSSGAMIIAAYFFGLFLLTAISLVLPPARLYLGICFGIYALANLVSSLVVALKNDSSQIFRLPAIYFVIHFGLGWGFLAEALRYFTGRNQVFSGGYPQK